MHVRNDDHGWSPACRRGAEHRSARERRLESWLEEAMLTLLLVVGVPVALVLRHTVVRRNRHLSRML